MKLTPEQILDIVHGTLFTLVTDEGEVSFHRFSAKQKQVYTAQKENFGVKCCASAGVMLDFITNSDVLSFTAEFTPGSSKNFADIDVLIDGVLFYNENRELGTFDFSFDLPEGEHRVTVVLPWSAAAKLCGITLSDGASLYPVEKNVRILSLGDSITQGYTTRHPSISYVNHFALRMNAEVLNQGIGGYRFLKDSIDSEIGWLPDVITLAYGTNDYSHHNNLDDYLQDARNYVDTLCAAFPDTPILAITPIYRGGEQDLAERASLKNGFTFYDAVDALKQLFHQYPQITLLNGLDFYPRCPEFFLPDYLHPNELGFMLYGQAVETALKNII